MGYVKKIKKIIEKKKRKRQILLGNVLETQIVNELPILVNFPIESLFLMPVL